MIFYPVQASLYQQGLVYQSNIGTHQEVKKAHRPPWGAMGLLAGAGDGHYGANAAPKGRPYGVDGKAPIDWYRADEHGVIEKVPQMALKVWARTLR